MKFKKLLALGATALMMGSTVLAATYPAPFVSSGTANGAIVVGANAASSDWSAAIDLQGDLNAGVTSDGTGSEVTGGDNVGLWRSSDRFNLGNLITTVASSTLDDDDMPNLLAEGTYTDDLNEEFEYKQTVTMAPLKLVHFSDDDYMEDTPTIGINLSSSDWVLNYTLDFKKNPTWTPYHLETTDIRFLGKDYYVLDVVNTTTAKLTLLDTADSSTVSEGEEISVNIGGNPYTVSIAFVGSATETKLTVNGETTNSLAEGGTYKLSDGSYVGIKDIMYTGKDTGISSVEFSIGKGKLELTDGAVVELNDDNIDELTADIRNTTTLDQVVLEWITDDEVFITPDSELLMPGFEALKLTMADLVVPTEEIIEVTQGSDDRIVLKAPLESGDATVNLLYATADTGNFTGLGKDASNLLVTTTGTELIFNYSKLDRRFIASWNTTTEGESYYLETTSWSADSTTGINYTTIRSVDNPDTIKQVDLATGDTANFGNIELTINAVKKAGDEKWMNITINAGGSFDTLYTKEGLKVFLPVADDGYGSVGSINLSQTLNATFLAAGNLSGHNVDKYWLFMQEEDKDSNLAKGTRFNITLNDDSEERLEVASVDSGRKEYKVGDTDDYESYVQSDLATKIVRDSKGDPDNAVVTYHGDQIYAELYLTAPDATIGSGGDGSNVVVVKDSEASSVKDTNLVVVGGSCINTVAATILGSDSPLCGEEFSALTNVAAGQYLIKVVASPLNAEKIAMLVAGYDAADTTNAVAKVKEGGVSTAEGTEEVYPVASA